VELCIAHTDSIPRFLNYYQLNGNEKQLIGKNYISESQNSGCFQLKLTKKQRRNKVGISISDAYGNESELLPLNLK
jgi:hypothetical protein